jgi:hypothetical protein
MFMSPHVHVVNGAHELSSSEILHSNKSQSIFRRYDKRIIGTVPGGIDGCASARAVLHAKHVSEIEQR